MEDILAPEKVEYDETEHSLAALLQRWNASYNFDPPPYDPGPFNNSLTPEQRQQQEQERRRVAEERRKEEEEERKRQEEDEQQRQGDDESEWQGYTDSTVYLSHELAPRITSREEYAAEMEHQRARLRECVSHDLLVKEGGRPWYPIERLLEVSRRPTENQALLKYWIREALASDQFWWMVFTSQLKRWRSFRAWQSQIREEFPIFQEYISLAKSYLTKNSTQDMLDMLVLHKDPNDQDRLSNWIEYLLYEMREHEAGAWSKTEAAKNHHAAAWKRRANHGPLTRRVVRTYVENPGYDLLGQRGGRQRKAWEADWRRGIRRKAPRSNWRGSHGRRSHSLDERDLDSSRGTSHRIAGFNNATAKYLDTTDNFITARQEARNFDNYLGWMHNEAYAIRDELEAEREQEMEAAKQRELEAARQRELEAARQRELEAARQRELEGRSAEDEDLAAECLERLERIETLLFGPDRRLHPTFQYNQSVQAAAEASRPKRPRSPSPEPEASPSGEAVSLDNTSFFVNLTFRPRDQEAAGHNAATSVDASSADAATSAVASSADAATGADVVMSADDAPTAASGSPGNDN